MKGTDRHARLRSEKERIRREVDIAMKNFEEKGQLRNFTTGRKIGAVEFTKK